MKTGTKVKSYRNLHKKCLSVQTMTKKGWRVTAHVQEITLSDVEFRVSETGRQRVLNEKRKNVHAFVIGFVSEDKLDYPNRLSYNPYKNTGFSNEAGEVVKSAKHAKVTTKGVFI
jgi:hypothetical protein